MRVLECVVHEKVIEVVIETARRTAVRRAEKKERVERGGKKGVERKRGKGFWGIVGVFVFNTQSTIVGFCQ